MTVCLAAGLGLSAVQASAQGPSMKGGNMMADVHPMAKDAMDMKKAKEMAAPCDDAESQRADDDGGYDAKGDGYGGCYDNGDA